MTKKQFEDHFREEVLPSVIERYEQDGIPDKPARREAWNDTVDAYIRDRMLPEAAGNWGHPRWLKTWSPRSGGPHHSTMKRKSPAQLEREIAEALASKHDRGVLGGLNRYRDQLAERPMADPGLISYRIRSPYGSYIMIGARDHDDAMREAARSTPNPKRSDLEIWNGARYVKASSAGRGSRSTTPRHHSTTKHPLTLGSGGLWRHRAREVRAQIAGERAAGGFKVGDVVQFRSEPGTGGVIRRFESDVDGRGWAGVATPRGDRKVPTDALVLVRKEHEARVRRAVAKR